MNFLAYYGILVTAGLLLTSECRILRRYEPDVVSYFDRPTPDEELRSALISRLLGEYRGRSKIVEDERWSPQHVADNLGQTSGIDVDGRGFVHVFHRGSTVWDAGSFGPDNVYRHPKKFVEDPAIWVLDPKTGEVVKRWGENMFLMPHGLYIDHEDNVWVTDVGLHQVMKFAKNETRPSLVLGEALVPGDDSAHFCKPTGVAVSSTGVVFVADGYCNRRVAVFDGKGRFLTEIGRDDGMLVPHSIVLLEQNNTLCVADRENARILCYAAEGPSRGDLKFERGDGEFGKVYAIAAHGNRIYGVEVFGSFDPPVGFVTEASAVSDVETFVPKQPFITPHDIAVSRDGRDVYVVDVNAAHRKKIYKFAV